MTTNLLTKIKPNKRGQFGLESVAPVARVLIGIGLLLVIAVLILGTLDESSLFTDGSAAANASSNILQNYSEGVGEFVTNIPTIFLVLGILVIILILGVLLRSVQGRNFGGGSA